jgi:hypothetical protein
MIIHRLKIPAGYGYSNDVRLMIFYMEKQGEEVVRVALMPHGCEATDESQFTCLADKAICDIGCQTCPLNSELEPMTFEQLAKSHNIRFDV